jgi:ATP-dependent DNA ligase
MKFVYPFKSQRISVDSDIFTKCSEDENFILQIKKNGWRVQIHKDREDVKFFTRHNKRMETLVDADWKKLTSLVLENIKAESIILDGEFMHMRGSIKNTIFLWDVFYYNGNYCSSSSYKERKDLLSKIVAPDVQLQISQDYQSNFQQVWEELSNKEEDEGVVIKDLREKLKVAHTKLSNDKSPRQFKVLLEDKRNLLEKVG